MKATGSDMQSEYSIYSRSFFTSPLSSSFSPASSSSSKRHFERRFVKYSSRQLFEIVADVDSYR